VLTRFSCLAILLLAVAGSASAANWVLTAQGWRQPAELLALPARPAPRLHPLVLAGFQVTASAFALLALSPGESRRNPA
jgi:hypothetical protein